ncbi:MAG: hypothetical protein DRP09_11565 [Candidatus Thorarchaeota archaeon]|nr:MAG: hypothetical protein DRP09_11565 [Candidatus Thorarchaeota archaeon]
MTESEPDDISKDDEPVMSEDDADLAMRKLSPSAKALLTAAKDIEEGVAVNLFQEDDESRHLRQMVSTFRGSLHSVLLQRLREVVQLGDVTLCSQRDLTSLIRELWQDNISRLSRTELPFLEAALRSPGRTLTEMAKNASLSYAKARRAEKRLRTSGVLRIGGMLNTHALGLERILILSQNPSFVLGGPYVSAVLFSDSHSPTVLHSAIVPHERIDEISEVVRSIRDSAESAVVWRLSAGHSRMSGTYHSSEMGWNINLLHFRLMLRRDGDPLTIADTHDRAGPAPTLLNGLDTKIIDALVDRFDVAANSIGDITGVSKSTVFRRRSLIIKNRLVLPRARVSIPRLSDRVCCILSPRCAGDIVHAWACLPLSYLSRIERLDRPKHKDAKVLLVSALPAGSGRDIIRILKEEVSKVHEADDFMVFAVSAGMQNYPRVSTLYDIRRSTWNWDSNLTDVLSYGILRREASEYNIPLDLA